MEVSRVTVLYDGHCYICNYEVQKYLKMSPKIQGVDILLAEFDAKKFKLKPKDVQRKLHVLVETSDGKSQVHVGIDAFIAIWKNTDRTLWHLAARMVSIKKLRPFFDFGYLVFADQIRPLLPKRNSKNTSRCANGACEH